LELNGAAERGGRRTRHGREAGDVAAPRNQAWRQRKCDEGRETEHGAGRRWGWVRNEAWLGAETGRPGWAGW